MSPDARERAGLLVRIGLVLVVAFLAATRLTGTDYLLPHLSEPDQNLVQQTEYLWEGGDPKAAPLSFFWYYALLPHALALTPDPAFAAARAARDSLPEQLAAASEPVRRMRVLVAILAVLAGPGTYWLARRFLRPPAALLAAALLASSFLHMQFSTQARPHAAETTLALFAVLAALHLRGRPTLGSYATAGVLAALAIGCLQNGVFVLPPLFVAHVLREQRDGEPERTRLLARALSGTPRLAFAALFVVAGFLWFGPAFNEEQADTRWERPPYGRTPHALEAVEGETYADALAVGDGAIELGPQRLELDWFDGSGFPRSAQFLWWNDPVLLVLSAVGALFALARGVRACRALPPEARRPRFLEALRRALDAPRGRDLAVVLAYALPFLFVVGTYAHTWGRFLLPALPYFACLSAFAFEIVVGSATRGLRSRASRRLAGACAGLAVLALPVYATAHRAVLQNRPDTLELAVRWIEEHVDPREHGILVEQSLTLPLFFRRDALENELQYRSAQRSRWYCYQDLFLEAPPADQAYDARRLPQNAATRQALADPAGARALVRASGADYAVLEASQRTLAFPAFVAFHAAVAECGELVQRFTAREPEASDLFWKDYQDAPSMLWRDLRAHRLGPRIEIWRLKSASSGER